MTSEKEEEPNRREYIENIIMTLENDGEFYRQVITLSLRIFFSRMTARIREEFHTPYVDRNMRGEIFINLWNGWHDHHSQITVADIPYKHIRDEMQNVTHLPQPTKEIIMADTVTPIQKQTLIYGQNTADMTEQDFLHAITKIENQIAQFEKSTSGSKRIAAKIDKLKEDQKAIVEAFDSVPDVK